MEHMDRLRAFENGLTRFFHGVSNLRASVSAQSFTFNMKKPNGCLVLQYNQRLVDYLLEQFGTAKMLISISSVSSVGLVGLSSQVFPMRDNCGIMGQVELRDADVSQILGTELPPARNLKLIEIYERLASVEHVFATATLDLARAKDSTRVASGWRASEINQELNVVLCPELLESVRQFGYSRLELEFDPSVERTDADPMWADYNFWVKYQYVALHKLKVGKSPSFLLVILTNAIMQCTVIHSNLFC
ncbi:TPA: hypothetical protein DF272_06420 [Candidatus Falkowbacteria bacterium]|nr:hypothetical protein [Candidatus Falkowbacteria bacterium]